MMKAFQEQREFNDRAKADCEALQQEVQGLAKQTHEQEDKSAFLQETLGSYH
jgi:hypothetical protein